MGIIASRVLVMPVEKVPGFAAISLLGLVVRIYPPGLSSFSLAPFRHHHTPMSAWVGRRSHLVASNLDCIIGFPEAFPFGSSYVYVPVPTLFVRHCPPLYCSVSISVNVFNVPIKPVH